MNELEKYENFYLKVKNNDISILTDPDIYKFSDFEGNTFLHLFAKNKNIEILKHEKVSIIKNNNGDTPLHLLSKYIDKCISVLLTHKDISIVKNNQGVTPLHILANRFMIQIINHIDCDKIRDCNGDTPLHFLCKNITISNSHIYKEVIKRILLLPVSNIININNDSILHILARNKVLEIVNNSDSFTVKNNDNETPFYILMNKLHNK